MKIKHPDKYWMQLALSLAKKGIGITSPNPPVGAVIVRHNKLISSGWHKGAGLPHAEVNAFLRQPPDANRGATLYVTLEPCCTWGKTPPCTDLIIREKIKRVVVGCKDPNPLHCGKGIRILRKAGIDVCINVCRDEAKKLIMPFEKRILTTMPFVTLKMALSLDGRIADKKGCSRWITCEQSRQIVKQIRKGVDAIIIGGNTALVDNPSLLSPCAQKQQPLRIILSSQRINTSLRLFNDDWAHKTILAVTDYPSLAVTNKLEAKGIQIWYFKSSNHKIPLLALLHKLGKMGCLHVLIEGGGTIAGSFIAENLVDRYLFFIAPIFLGADGKSVITSHNWPLKNAPQLCFRKVCNVGNDILILATPLSHDKKIVYDSDISLCLPA